MGFWQTGYMEFHEPTGLNFPISLRPPRYHCEHCQEIFDSVEELRRHRFERHTYVRPALFVRGIELGATPFHVSRAVSAKDFVVGQCTSAVVNGANVRIDALAKHLVSFTNERVQINLSNETVRATYEIVFGIALERDLDAVEKCFLKLARGRKLDMRAIEGFIVDARPFCTGIAYCDAICQYLYGVLVKERAADASIPYEAYRDKFNQAAYALTDYERPLARAIRALVAFHFNHFEDAAALLPGGRLATASERFAGWLKGKTHQTAKLPLVIEDRGIEDLLTDLETARVLRWVLAFPELCGDINDIKAIAKQELPTYDHVKLSILLGEYYATTGDNFAARYIGRELINTPATSGWAEQLLNRVKLLEKNP